MRATIKKSNRFSLLRLISSGLLSSWILFGATGCATTQKAQTKDNGVIRPLPFEKLQNVPKADLLDEKPIAVSSDKSSSLPQQEMNIQRTEGAALKLVSAYKEGDVTPYPRKDIPALPEDKKELLIDLNLDNVQVSELTAAIAAPEMLNFSYVVDPAVKGAVTVSIKATMTAAEIWDTFQHLLWLSGAYPSVSNGFVNILPFSKMAKDQRLLVKHDAQANVDLLFAPIRFRKSSEILTIVRPFLTDGATISEIATANSVVVVDTPANTQKIKELIKILDNKGEREWPVRCIACREVDSDQVASELLGLLPVLGMPIAPATGFSAGAIKITSIPRMGAIVVSAAMEEILDEVANWVKLLDKEDTMDQEDIYFYNVQHSTVSKVTSAMEAFFNTTITYSPTTSTTSSSKSAGSLSKRTSSTKSTTTTNNNRNTTNKNKTTKSNAATAFNTRLNIFETEVMVYADDESNRLTIKTNPRAWKLIKAFLERQDIPPRQVSIRAIITNITLTKENEFGISYAINHLTGSNDQNTLSGMLGFSNPNTALTGTSTITGMMGNNGLGLLFQGGNNNSPLVFLKSIAGKGNTKILSEPHVLVVSGATAKVNVGQKIAIPTESTTYSSDDNMKSNYEYTDTGVIMEVTPYITAGNEVRMVVSQEISSAEESTDPTIPPVINTKTLSSELVVPDNSTLIMGGMIHTEKSKVYSGIPLLMDIPYLGALFRYNSLSNRRTELLILMTVNVIDPKHPQEELVRRYKASLEAIEAANKKENIY